MAGVRGMLLLVAAAAAAGGGASEKIKLSAQTYKLKRQAWTIHLSGMELYKKKLRTVT